MKASFLGTVRPRIDVETAVADPDAGHAGERPKFASVSTSGSGSVKMSREICPWLVSIGAPLTVANVTRSGCVCPRQAAAVLCQGASVSLKKGKQPHCLTLGEPRRSVIRSVSEIRRGKRDPVRSYVSAQPCDPENRQAFQHCVVIR